jgi:hypothetical protein
VVWRRLPFVESGHCSRIAIHKTPHALSDRITKAPPMALIDNANLTSRALGV